MYVNADKGSVIMQCQYCDTQIKDEDIQCASCGSRLDALEGWEITAPKKTKITAGALALLLGGLGLHKFYLGSWGAGVLYLLFIWTGIPILLAIVEGLRYLAMTDEVFAEKTKSLKGPFAFLW